MPIYSYKCSSCEYACKLFHGVEEKPGKCPKCNNDNLTKTYLSSPAVKIVDNGSTPQKRIEKYIEETRAAVAEQLAEARKEI